LRNHLETRQRLPRDGSIRSRRPPAWPCHIRLQRVLREIVAEVLEADEAGPLLLRDEQRSRVEIRVGAHLRGGHLRDPEEVVDRAGTVPPGSSAHLLVDGGASARRWPSLRIVGRHQSCALGIARFGFGRNGPVEVGIRDHRIRPRCLPASTGGWRAGKVCAQRWPSVVLGSERSVAARVALRTSGESEKAWRISMNCRLPWRGSSPGIAREHLPPAEARARIARSAAFAVP